VAAEVTKIYSQLSLEMRSSFAPVPTLIAEAMNGYDTHFLQLSNAKKQFRGLLVFN